MDVDLCDGESLAAPRSAAGNHQRSTPSRSQKTDFLPSTGGRRNGRAVVGRGQPPSPASEGAGRGFVDPPSLRQLSFRAVAASAGAQLGSPPPASNPNG